jgi:hydrogenase/urease accessory protein HupE
MARWSRLAGRSSRVAIYKSGAFRAAVTFTAALVLAPGLASAHDPGLSSLTVVVEQGQVSATLSLSPADARLLVAEKGAALEALSVEGIDLRAGGVRVEAQVTNRTAGDADVSMHLSFERFSASRLSVRSSIPAWMPRGHRELLRIYAPGGRLLAERMLDAQTGEVDLDLTDAAADRGAPFSFFKLGLVHILEGYDHLLFLCALLLAARALKDVVKTTTAFTVGHSITLALAALGLVAAPAAIVEPMIALSIVWAGAESVRRPAGSRWLLAGLFGLVHGFGFAGALRDLGIGTSSIALAIPLASFNGGVEAGQIAVASVAWPALRALHARPALRARLVPACSILIVIAGTYWFAERTFL